MKLSKLLFEDDHPDNKSKSGPFGRYLFGTEQDKHKPTKQFINRKSPLVENSDAYVYRIDSKRIVDFPSSMRDYAHTPDWTESGPIGPGEELPAGWKRDKVLFAGGNLEEVVPYAAPRQTVRWLWLMGDKKIYFDQKDKRAIQNNKTWLSVFNRANFEFQPSGEWISSNPGNPVEQRQITDAVAFMREAGYDVEFVPDLDAVKNELDANGTDYNSEGDF